MSDVNIFTFLWVFFFCLIKCSRTRVIYSLNYINRNEPKIFSGARRNPILRTRRAHTQWYGLRERVLKFNFYGLTIFRYRPETANNIIG